MLNTTGNKNGKEEETTTRREPGDRDQYNWIASSRAPPRRATVARATLCAACARTLSWLLFITPSPSRALSAPRSSPEAFYAPWMHVLRRAVYDALSVKSAQRATVARAVRRRLCAVHNGLRRAAPPSSTCRALSAPRSPEPFLSAPWVYVLCDVLFTPSPQRATVARVTLCAPWVHVLHRAVYALFVKSAQRATSPE